MIISQHRSSEHYSKKQNENTEMALVNFDAAAVINQSRTLLRPKKKMLWFPLPVRA
jgi:hypothetical protein